jgi:hypothetical protein
MVAQARDVRPEIVVWLVLEVTRRIRRDSREVVRI